jgi:NADPH-dependent ferric siderophore reductase
VDWCVLAPGAPPGEALAAAVRDVDLTPDARVWVAGEAAAVQRIRRHLFEEREIPRARTAVRGYWKHGRAGDGGDAE